MKDMGIEIQILDWLQKLHTPVLDKIDPEDEKEWIDPGRGAGCGCSPLQCDFKASGSQNPAL